MANYYKPGPATQSELRNRLVKIDNSQKYGFQSKWYISGNAIEGYPEILADNWSGAVGFEEGTNATLNKSSKAFEGSGFVYENPATAYQKVLAEAGALIPRRDAVDLRIIEEVKSGKPTFGNGIPDKVEQTGSWSLLKSSVSPADSDLDGMPDVWEKKNGLNPKNSADGNEDKNGNGYTNLEEYLNELMKIKP